jgi:hypothetical protein
MPPDFPEDIGQELPQAHPGVRGSCRQSSQRNSRSLAVSFSNISPPGRSIRHPTMWRLNGRHLLSAPLREDARRAVGWSAPRGAARGSSGASGDDDWIVAANLSEVQPDKLRRLETWLVNAAPGEGEPRAAVLIDFAPASGGAFGFPFEPGEPINGEVVFYPSLAPLRGLRRQSRSTGRRSQGRQANRRSPGQA